jgi:CYTH domain-containing protein
MQWYLTINPNREIRIRKKVSPQWELKYTRTIKETQSTGVRSERDEKITEEKFDQLFYYTSDLRILKTRYYIPLEWWLIAELDVFWKNDFTVEVEFKDDESMKSFVPPSRFWQEVTGQKEYDNAQRAIRRWWEAIEERTTWNLKKEG